MKFTAFLLFSVRSALALALGLTAIEASAGQVVLEWTAPTQCSDGTALSNCATTGYSIHYGTVTGSDISACSAAALTQVRNHMFPQSLSTPVAGLNPGNYCFAMKTVSASGSSALSNILFKTVVNPLPNPPVLSVVNSAAMSVTADWEKLAFLPSKPVGTVPLGTPCDPTKALADGYYAVPREKVEWSGSNRPANVVAKCAGVEL